MRRWLLVAALLGVVAAPARAQIGATLVITLRVDGTVLRPGASYYVAFGTDPSLLGGPRPDGTGWTHYVLFRDGRFWFGTIPQATVGPIVFEQERPPVPIGTGQVLADGTGIRVSVNSADVGAAGTPPGGVVKVNLVTVDRDALVQSDALGMGRSDPLGFVAFDLRRDVFVPMSDPRGDATPPLADLDIVGGEIRIGP